MKLKKMLNLSHLDASNESKPLINIYLLFFLIIFTFFIFYFRKEKLTMKKIIKRISNYKFPYWFKVVPYMLSFIFVGVSLFFIISQSIMFGNEKVRKWITSLVVSFFTSIIFTQPIKVFLNLF